MSSQENSQIVEEKENIFVKNEVVHQIRASALAEQISKNNRLNSEFEGIKTQFIYLEQEEAVKEDLNQLI